MNITSHPSHPRAMQMSSSFAHPTRLTCPPQLPPSPTEISSPCHMFSLSPPLCHWHVFPCTTTHYFIFPLACMNSSPFPLSPKICQLCQSLEHLSYGNREKTDITNKDTMWTENDNTHNNNTNSQTEVVLGPEKWNAGGYCAISGVVRHVWSVH